MASVMSPSCPGAMLDSLKLSRPDSLIFQLMQIGLIQRRLSCLRLLKGYQEQANTLLNQLMHVSMACNELLGNEALKRLLGLLMVAGNFLNAGSGKPAAVTAIKVSSLAKVAETKSVDGRKTL